MNRSASEKEIRSAYRKLARKLHPDVNPNDKASEARFKEINAAYDVLSDADKRKKYDKYGDNWEHADEIERAQRAQRGRGGRLLLLDARWPQRRVRRRRSTWATSSAASSAARRRSAARQRRATCTREQPVEVTLEEAFHGTTRTAAWSTATAASSAASRSRSRPASTTARASASPARARAGFDGRRGDLYLVSTSGRTTASSARATTSTSMSKSPLTTAVLGGEVEVQALDKKVALKLPPVTQNGRTFRLAGLGMPKLERRRPARRPLRAGEGEAARGAGREERKLFEELKAAGNMTTELA